jgi:uncharacterized repeat protein (TIGR02543 family)
MNMKKSLYGIIAIILIALLVLAVLTVMGCPEAGGGGLPDGGLSDGDQQTGNQEGGSTQGGGNTPPPPPPTRYTVSFNTNGGSAVTSKTNIPNGGKVAQPEDPTRTDHCFDGWYKEAVFTTKWDFGTDRVSGSITLHAKWLTYADANGRDFGSAAVETSIPVTDKSGWDTALSTISGGGNNKNYVLTVDNDITIPKGLGSGDWSFGNADNVTVSLRGTGSLNLNGDGESSNRGSLFKVNAGQKLILRGLTLRGNQGGNDTLIVVNGSSAEFTMESGAVSGNSVEGSGGVSVLGGTFTMNGGTISGMRDDGVSVAGGTFIMNNGAISDNNNFNTGGGVKVYDTGTFTMSGGAVSSNTAAWGGGVFVDGTFEMSGGSISGNIANSAGGGVYINGGTFTMSGGDISDNTGEGVLLDGGTFTMSGGTISDNTTAESGGGVLVLNDGTFTMNNGTISGNTAGYGGGVMVYYGTFTKSGGIIYGKDEGVLSNLANNDTQGHAVYKLEDDTPSYTGKYRDNTAGSAVNINTGNNTGLQ